MQVGGVSSELMGRAHTTPLCFSSLSLPGPLCLSGERGPGLGSQSSGVRRPKRPQCLWEASRPERGRTSK